MKANPLIMIVDDNQANIQVIAGILELNDYDIAVAQSGEECLLYLENELPDLILLDVMMPGIDGFETCRRIKKKEIEGIKYIPVIFLTAKSETGDLIKGFSSGAVDYVTKPFDSEELLARIRTHVELKRAREEIKTLQAMLPICSFCHKVRDEKGYWESIERYISAHTDTEFSHSVCADCLKEKYPDFCEDLVTQGDISPIQDETTSLATSIPKK